MRRQLVLQQPWKNLARGAAPCRLHTTQMRSIPNLKKHANNMVEGEEVPRLKFQVLEMKQGMAKMKQEIKGLKRMTNGNDIQGNHHNLHNSSDPDVILSERLVQQEFCGRRSRGLILVDQAYLDRLRESMAEVKSMYMETKEEIIGLKQLMINIKLHVIEDHDHEEANNNHSSKTSDDHVMKHRPVEETKVLRDSRDVITSNKTVEHHQGDHSVMEIEFEVDKLVFDAFDLRCEIKAALEKREGVEAAGARSIDELKRKLLLAKSRFSEVERKLIKAMEENENWKDDQLRDLKYFKWRLKDVGDTFKMFDALIEIFDSEKGGGLFQFFLRWLMGKG